MEKHEIDKLQTIICTFNQFNTFDKRLVQVKSGDRLFKGELTQILWDADHWIVMVDGEWFPLSELV